MLIYICLILGGLTAVIWTDAIQMVIIITGSLVLSVLSQYIIEYIVIALYSQPNVIFQHLIALFSQANINFQLCFLQYFIAVIIYKFYIQYDQAVIINNFQLFDSSITFSQANINFPDF